jgi:hypothetical protein
MAKKCRIKHRDETTSQPRTGPPSMSFSIEWGVPEMWALRRDLQTKFDANTIGGDERLLFRKLQKCVLHLAENPKHPGLASHEIDDLSARFGQKVWQSYLENRKPAAGRLFWVYGPEKGVITIVGLEPHPESGKAKGYASVKLSKTRTVTAADKPPRKGRSR